MSSGDDRSWRPGFRAARTYSVQKQTRPFFR